MWANQVFKMAILIFGALSSSLAASNPERSIKEWESLMTHDEVAFVSEQGPLKLMDLYISAGKSEEAIEFGQSHFRLRIALADRAEFEYLAWKAHAEAIPPNADRCIQNMLTRRCDEGEGLIHAAEIYEQRNPGGSRVVEMQAIAEKFYRYKFDREFKKLQLFADQYEVAVKPQSLRSKLINNVLRGNSRRTDHKVWAKCVGGQENGKLNGKCDLVYKHDLLGRIINQASRIEEFARAEDSKNVLDIKLDALKELKVLFDTNSQLRQEAHSSLSALDLKSEIEKYQQLIKELWS